MRIRIFADAIRIQQYLQEVGSCHNKLSFQYNFKDKICPKCEGTGKLEDKLCDRCGGKKKIASWVNVCLEIEDNKTVFNCSCAHHSLHEAALCQYLLGVFFYMFKKQMRRLKKKW